jgi:hypothetical protein
MGSICRGITILRLLATPVGFGRISTLFGTGRMNEVVLSTFDYLEAERFG